MKYYFVIHSGEDGPSVERMPEVTLLSRLNEGYWGDTTVWTPEMLDKHARGNTTRIELNEVAGLLILHADVIVPKPEKVVETWALR